VYLYLCKNNYDLYLTLFNVLRLKISRSNFRITKLTEYDICDSLATLCFSQRLSRYGGIPWRRKNSALASIPKAISIGNVRITNRRYNTRVHCVCQESRSYIHLQTVKSRFLTIRYLPLAKLFF